MSKTASEQDVVLENALSVRSFLESRKVMSIRYIGGDDKNGEDFRFYFESGRQARPMQFFMRLEELTNRSKPRRTKLLRFIPPRRAAGETGVRILSPEDCTPTYGFESEEEGERYVELVNEVNRLRDMWSRTLRVLNGLRNQDPRALKVFEGMLVSVTVLASTVNTSHENELSDSKKVEFLTVVSILRILAESKKEPQSRLAQAVMNEYFPKIGLEHLGRETVGKRVRSRIRYHLKRLQRMNPGKKRSELDRLKDLVASFVSSYLK